MKNPVWRIDHLFLLLALVPAGCGESKEKPSKSVLDIQLETQVAKDQMVESTLNLAEQAVQEGDAEKLSEAAAQIRAQGTHAIQTLVIHVTDPVVSEHKEQRLAAIALLGTLEHSPTITRTLETVIEWDNDEEIVQACKETYAGLRTRIAREAIQEQDLEWAIQQATQALEYVPDHADAYSVRGKAHLQSQDLEKALQDCSKAVELAPLEARFYLQRAKVHQQSGNPLKAESDLEKAAQLENESAAPSTGG